MSHDLCMLCMVLMGVFYAALLVGFWSRGRRIRTLSGRVRALLDLSRDRVVSKIREGAPGYSPGERLGSGGCSLRWALEEDVLDALPDPGLARRFP